MWVDGCHKFITVLILAQVILLMGTLASGVEAVLLLAAPVSGIFPVPGNAAGRIKFRGENKSGTGLCIHWHSLPKGCKSV